MTGLFQHVKLASTCMWLSVQLHCKDWKSYCCLFTWYGYPLFARVAKIQFHCSKVEGTVGKKEGKKERL